MRVPKQGEKIPEKLFRGVAAMSPHHLEAQNHGTCTPRGGEEGHANPIHHTGGRTEDSGFTAWTETRSVAVGYARSSPSGLGVVLEILFQDRTAISNDYRYQGNRLGEDEWLIFGKIHDVRVTPIRRDE